MVCRVFQVVNFVDGSNRQRESFYGWKFFLFTLSTKKQSGGGNRSGQGRNMSILAKRYERIPIVKHGFQRVDRVTPLSQAV